MSPSLPQMVTDCTTQLFWAYRVTLKSRQSESRPEPGAVTRDATLVGAVCELSPLATAARGRGKLVLVTTFALVATTRPEVRDTGDLAPSSSADWIYVRDWVRELTNQLAGRLTSRLAAHGSHVTFASPVAVTGDAVPRELASKGGVHVCLSAPDRGPVDVVVVLPHDAQLGAGASGTAGAREGSVTLFDSEDNDDG